jgi:hypothetical protein
MDQRYEASSVAIEVSPVEKKIMVEGIEEIGMARDFFQRALDCVVRDQFATDRGVVIGVGNRSSERIYRGVYQPDEVFTLNQETARNLTERMGKEKLGLLMSRFNTAMDLALGIQKNNDPVIREGLLKAGNQASVELFGPKTKKIVFE